MLSSRNIVVLKDSRNIVIVISQKMLHFNIDGFTIGIWSQLQCFYVLLSKPEKGGLISSVLP